MKAKPSNQREKSRALTTWAVAKVDGGRKE
jgi:hypothetical protein